MLEEQSTIVPDSQSSIVEFLTCKKDDLCLESVVKSDEKGVVDVSEHLSLASSVFSFILK